MAIRIEIGPKAGREDPVGMKTRKDLSSDFPGRITDVKVYHVYTIDGEVDHEVLETLALSALSDPVIQDFAIESHLKSDFDWIVEVDFKPGVTDNEGRTATEALALLLNRPLREVPQIYYGCQYRISGDFSSSQVQDMADEHLANTLIQRIRLASAAEFRSQNTLLANPPIVRLNHTPSVSTHDLSVDDETLSAMSRKNIWALSVEEMRTIAAHLQEPEVVARRLELGLPREITDVEMECLAQSWSEHCKHKIFSATIEYTEAGETERIESLFKTYIKATTEKVRELKGDKDHCLSVFKDNAGVIKFNDQWGLVFKVETHNSPSALDPYGGALTGIVGVNRDPFGTGMGARLLFNTNMFCLADPFYDKEVPAGLLHPMRILEGVRKGVEHGGNQSGIPTINGSVLFDERYLGKPLVYCGTGGMLPLSLHGSEGFEKYPAPGDLIIMSGGRIGMDGIHGATFSSEELHDGSPSSAVQIGDPITQKRMFDFLELARDRGLYTAITDNGAGGLSSSVGEMATLTGGAILNLEAAPLKYAGLDPWEILVSESQERMTLAVHPSQVEEFLDLSRSMSVESTVIGEFTDSGYLEVFHGPSRVADLELHFLHEGLPPMFLQTEYTPPAEKRAHAIAPDPQSMLPRLLSRLNIASKEYWVRQYDHEVKGGSVIKPLMGAAHDGPSDSAVYRPFLESLEAIVVSHGVCPRYSDIDAGLMAANALDEAVRNAVASGGDPDTFAALDNFCWPDPLPPARENRQKLAALVRTNKELAKLCITYKIPLISGKDSMKNDARIGDKVISIPPTLLISLVGKLERADRAVSMDAKKAGDVVYVIGETAREMGKSEYFEELELEDTSLPLVHGERFIAAYRALHQAMELKLVASCHDCSDGGLGVALAEVAMAGRAGITADLRILPVRGSIPRDDERLFSESAGRFVVTIAPENQGEFEKQMAGHHFAPIGEVTDSDHLRVTGMSGEPVVDLHINDLLQSWKRPLALGQEA